MLVEAQNMTEHTAHNAYLPGAGERAMRERETEREREGVRERETERENHGKTYIENFQIHGVFDIL